MALDHNVTPYFDDFDETKNFLRLLFIPKRAVQARELTQLQTLLQHQTKTLSDRIFKDGSSVLGARVKVNFNKQFFEYTGTVTTLVVGDEMFIHVDDYVDHDVRLLITHIDVANSRIHYNIIEGTLQTTDILTRIGGGDVLTVTVEGYATSANIEDGIIYVGGLFLIVPTQELIVEATGANGDFIIGYTFDEDIVTSETDNTLLDPANGSFNFLAPGADRYHVEASLVSYVEGAATPTNFHQITLIRNGVVITEQNDVQYSDILDLLARRTFDESGNYALKEFPMALEDHDTDLNKIKIAIEPGKAYVLGYEHETIATTEIETDRARTTEGIQNASIYADYGPYIELADDGTGQPNIDGIFDITAKEPISLYSDIAATNLLGTARVTAILKGSNNKHRVYLSEVSDITDLLSSVKSISNGSVLAITNINTTTGLTVVGNKEFNVPVFPLSLTNVKTFNDVSYNFLRSFFTITVTAGSATIIASDDVSDFSNNPSDIVLINDETGAAITSFGVSATPSSGGSPSSIVISGLGGAVSIDVIANMGKRVGQHKTKTITTVTETLTADGSGNTPLANVDVMNIVSVVETGNGGGVATTNVTGIEVLDDGQQDYYYNYGSLSGLVASREYDITYKYFSHSGAGDYFSVDSYNHATNQGIDALIYNNIPEYTSKDGASVFVLRDSIDFRRSVDDLVTGTNLAIPGDTITLDYEFYLGRVDKVYLDEYGTFGVVKGVPSRYPDIPNELDNAMTLYILTLSPYTFELDDVDTQIIENKSYTMEDIGSLETRIESLEYYSALNLLEKETADLSVTDINGLEKFKNGIVVDDFSGHGIGDVYSSEYNCSIDPEEGVLRTPFSAESVDFDIVDNDVTLATKNMKKHEHISTLDYSEGVFIDQFQASESVNVNPFNVFLWVGTLEITPQSDNWIDTERKPSVVMNVAGANDNMRQIAGWFGTRWNGWRTMWSGVRKTSSTSTRRRRRWRETKTRTIRTTTTVQRNVGRSIRVIPGTIRRNIGDRIVDSSIIPFMRSKTISFKVSGCKPNTKMLAYFDGVDVSDLTVSTVPDTSMTTDAAGFLQGSFTIPNPNVDSRRFRTGSKIFRLADHATQPTTSSEASYTAKGLLQTKQNTIVSVENPRLVQANVIQSRVLTSRTASSKTSRRRTRWKDPVAESFVIDREGGVFISSVELYFRTKDGVLPVSLQIVENENGIPTQNVLPFSDVTLTPGEVTTSADGSAVTKFTFTDPVYLQDGTEYSFVVTSNSDSYELFVAQIGGTDLISNSLISKQPFAGVMFSSQNGSTWTPDQTKDIKFKINRCVFDIGSIGSFDLVSSSGLDNVNASTIMFNIDTLILNNTNIEWQYKYTTDPSLLFFDNKINIDMTELKTITLADTLNVTATFTSDNDAISPVINNKRSSAVLIENIITNTDDAGVYLTRTINLENPSDDLKVLFDAQFPGVSNVGVYYKTTESFNSRSVHTAIQGTAPSELFIGRTQYVFEAGVGSIDLVPDSTVVTTKVEQFGGEDIIFIKDITSYDNLIAGRILVTFEDDVVVNNIIDFSVATHSAGDLVYYTDGGVYESLIDVNDDLPTVATSWKKIGQSINTNINTQPESIWRPMKLEGTVNPQLDTENEFIEYTYIPDAVVDEEFSSFSVKIELKSSSAVNTPLVKAFRALAVY